MKWMSVVDTIYKGTLGKDLTESGIWIGSFMTIECGVYCCMAFTHFNCSFSSGDVSCTFLCFSPKAGYSQILYQQTILMYTCTWLASLYVGDLSFLQFIITFRINDKSWVFQGLFWHYAVSLEFLETPLTPTCIPGSMYLLGVFQAWTMLSDFSYLHIYLSSGFSSEVSYYCVLFDS